MTATTVNVPLAWTLGSGDTAVVIGDLLDGIYPGILSIAIVMVCMWLTKKGVRPLQIILGIIAIALLGAFLGVF